jgi:hypothetical protein
MHKRGGKAVFRQLDVALASEKVGFFASAGAGFDSSFVMRYPAFGMSAHGQNPSQNPTQTDLTKG